MNADHVTALFELGATVMVCFNLYALYKDSQVKGVSIWTTVFFVLWGVWNLFFYPAYGLYWSYVAGALMLFANLIWVLGATILYWEHKKLLRS